MCFIYTLKAFFKDEFKSGQSTYVGSPNDVPCKYRYFHFTNFRLTDDSKIKGTS